MNVEYRLRRVLIVLWRWEVELEGEVVKRGLAFSKAAARWAARGVIRGLRGAPTAADED